MIRHKHSILILTIASLICIFSSCQEEDVEFPCTLYSAAIKETSPLRMYSDGVEIHNDARLKALGSSVVFTVPDINKDDVSITFHSPNRLTTNLFYGNDDYFIEKKGNQFICTSKKFNVYSSDPYGIHAQILKHQPNDYQYEPSQGGYFSNTVFAAYGSYSNFELCYVAYLFKTSHFLDYGARQINEFNTKVIPRLTKNDTLVVKEFRVIFRPK